MVRRTDGLRRRLIRQHRAAERSQVGGIVESPRAPRIFQESRRRARRLFSPDPRHRRRRRPASRRPAGRHVRRECGDIVSRRLLAVEGAPVGPGQEARLPRRCLLSIGVVNRDQPRPAKVVRVERRHALRAAIRRRILNRDCRRQSARRGDGRRAAYGGHEAGVVYRSGINTSRRRHLPRRPQLPLGESVIATKFRPSVPCGSNTHAISTSGYRGVRHLRILRPHPQRARLPRPLQPPRIAASEPDRVRRRRLAARRIGSAKSCPPRPSWRPPRGSWRERPLSFRPTRSSPSACWCSCPRAGSPSRPSPRLRHTMRLFRPCAR